MKSVMQNQFQQIPSVNLPRSVFNRSHGHKTTFNEGKLIPVYCDEVLPGDTFSMKTSFFARLMTQVAPIMDNIFIEMFFFFVPMRLVWENAEKFFGQRDADEVMADPQPEYLLPTLPIDNETANLEGTIYDYFGIPIYGTGSPWAFDICSLPLRCYYKIYNDWFLDQNLMDPLLFSVADGPDSADDYELQNRCKRRDYFTSCLPWPQKAPAVTIPLGTSAPCIGNNVSLGFTDGTDTWGIVSSLEGTAGETHIATSDNAYGQTVGATRVQSIELEQRAIGLTTNPDLSGIIADLSAATAYTINSLREAFQLQKLFERDARGGTRYTEIVLSHFGVRSPDARLQRSEYLGGMSTRMGTHPVPQTSATAATAQANLAAYSTAMDNGYWSKSFTEHGYIIGLVNARADITYQQGLDRMWSRQTRYDLFWPSLQNLGEQEVLNKEIYCKGVANDDLVFGYQERYAEYRYKNSIITGMLRSENTTSLDVWHLSEEFSGPPSLNEEFIVVDETTCPISRALAATVSSYDHFLIDIYFDLKCARPMATYSIPGFIDHF